MTDPVSASELADIVAGELTLASLPPIGGMWEPVQRMVTDLADVSDGDVFWGIHPESQVPPEWAYASGALGVICDRPVEPWAGRFAIQIDDTQQCLSRLTDFAIQRQLGTRVFVIEHQQKTSQVIHQLLATKMTGEQFHGSSWPFDLLGSSAASDFIVAAINDSFLQINALAPQSHLCSSDILVISSLANDTWQMSDSLREFVVNETHQLTERNWLIFNSTNELTQQLSQSEARVVECQENDQGILPRGTDESDIQLACGVAQACNWSDEEIRNGLSALANGFAKQP